MRRLLVIVWMVRSGCVCCNQTSWIDVHHYATTEAMAVIGETQIRCSADSDDSSVYVDVYRPRTGQPLFHLIRNSSSETSFICIRCTPPENLDLISTQNNDADVIFSIVESEMNKVQLPRGHVPLSWMYSGSLLTDVPSIKPTCYEIDSNLHKHMILRSVYWPVYIAWYGGDFYLHIPVLMLERFDCF